MMVVGMMIIDITGIIINNYTNNDKDYGHDNSDDDNDYIVVTALT